jgi:RNA polymerase sigma factor (sigma-70 family)
MDSITELVQAAQAANPQDKRWLFDLLADHFQPIALSWARRILQESDAAEDAVQEALLTAYQHLDDLRDPAAFPGWLKRIVLTQCARIMRRRWQTEQPLDEEWLLADEDDDPAEQADARWQEAALQDAVGRLSLPERTVTQLYYLDDYSQQEIARLLQVPLTTVKKRLQYAREHLRERLPMNALRMPGDGALLPVLDWNLNDLNKWTLGLSAVLQHEELYG